MSTRVRSIALLVGLALLLVFPLVGDRFYVQFFSKILIMTIFAGSLNLLVGYTGLISLGHAAFFGIAGYILALYSPDTAAAGLLTSLLLSVGGAALLALLIGSLVVRTGGIFFIMATLAFAEMLFYLFHDTAIAGGSDGIYIYQRPTLMIAGWQPLDLANIVHFYYLVLFFSLAAIVSIHTLLRSPFGKVIVGIRVNEQRMRALGFHTYRYKLVCFVIAGALAGLAGYLAASQFGVVNPEMLGWHLSGSVLMMVILGGMGTLVGPVLGAFSLMMLEEGFQSITKHWQLLTGAVIVLVALYLPRGFAGLLPKRTGNKTLPPRSKGGTGSSAAVDRPYV
ncbi:MAG: branched-chain amino acid ABC transporter permease [Betaproteobacteria bacterium]|nr:MAG: branched-chain amino acid ABC transporter permease [Betaproteobacteria bacterium]